MCFYGRRRIGYFVLLCLVPALVVLASLSITFPTTATPEYRVSDKLPSAPARVHGRRGDRAALHCEIIDVAIVVRGQSSCTHAALLIKSILLFRRNPIRFHFFVDDAAQYILSTLMSTWHLYGVEYNFHKIALALSETDMLNDPIIEALLSSLERVIILDCTVLLSADIFHLWKIFSDMERQGSVFGLVKGTKSWEFDTENLESVMLVNIKSLRERKQRENVDVSETHIYLLNPGWSTDYHDTPSSPPCYKEQRVCVHSSVGSSYFKTIVQEYDGNLLRQKWIDCQTGPTFDQNAIDYHAKTSVYAPPCTDFTRQGQQERRMHLFYEGQVYDSSRPSDDVTLLLHLSLDRVSMLEPMCRHWEGPMSIAVFVNDSEVSLFLDLIQSSPTISSRCNIAYHIVYKEGRSIYYPSNSLRLVALQNALTDHVFFDDVDFLPSFGLHSYLKEMVHEVDLSHSVLVVPAFETYQKLKDLAFPSNKKELIKMFSDKSVFQFHRHTYIRGHAPTHYTKWMTAKTIYEIQWQPQYEPYLVATRNITPLDTRFVSRDFNKVSHIEEIYYQRYRFHVVPDGFILHLPHPLSKDSNDSLSNSRHRDCYVRRKSEWREDMAKKYGNEPYFREFYKIWDRLFSSYETSF